MIIKRKEGWGTLTYDTVGHRFSYVKKNGKDAVPYIQEPIVLNVDLTFKCNMACRHCVAKDFDEIPDLVVSQENMRFVNTSPFMVVVITGGEPMLPEYEDRLRLLLRQISNKGIVIDTNGTIKPTDSLVQAIREVGALIRVSWDSVRPQDEIHFRRVGKTKRENGKMELEYYWKKIDNVKYLKSKGLNVAVQTVIHRINLNSVLRMPDALNELGVKQWYIQRFIPSYKAAEEGNLDIPTYEVVIANLKKQCQKLAIECIAKKDKRHNSVFLLVGDGLIYTQGEKPRQKIEIGSIKHGIRYFDYVSCSDHSDRYYGGS